MNQDSSRKKISCFQCGTLSAHDEHFCSVCRFDIGSEISERNTSCLLLKLAAVAFALGAAVPILFLFIIGELGARELPVLGVGGIVIAVAVFAWYWAQKLTPQYVFVPATGDLRSVGSASRSDESDNWYNG